MTLIRKIIPLVLEGSADASLSTCAGAEPFALMVLGDSMMPEFEEGEIIIIEPEGLTTDGSFVLAFHNEEYIFRQLVRREGDWYLHPLNTHYEEALISDLSVVKGVIIQKQRPGSRRSRKTYVAKRAH
ncbi:MAG: S24 family peptidase [Sulfuriferula sp.]